MQAMALGNGRITLPDHATTNSGYEKKGDKVRYPIAERYNPGWF